MRKKFPILFLLAGLAIFVSQFCGTAFAAFATPTAQQIGAQATFQGMQAAMKCAPGTFIMEKGNLLLMAWPQGSRYAFTIVGKGGEVGQSLTGLNINTLSISAMVKSLEQGGWKYIAPTAVPAALADLLGMLTVEMAMTSMRALPSVFLVPVMLFEPTPLPQY